MKSIAENSFKQYFSKNIKALYIFTSSIILLGYLLDTVLFISKMSIVVINLSVILLVLFFFTLGLMKKIEISSSYLLIIYSTLLGLFSAFSYNILTSSIITHLLIQNLILLPLLIFSVGFIVSKKQMFIVGIIIAVVFPMIIIASQIDELIEITPFITIMILVSTFTMNLFISSMDDSIKENKLKEEELLKQKKSLELLNRDRNNLFSVISHDLRGPVGSSKQMIKYMLDNETSNEEKIYLLEAINASIGNSFHLLNNLLLWARSERGAIEIAPDNIKLSKSISDSINLLQKSIEEKSITVENRINNGLHSFSDKNLLETIIRNLLANAIKFTNDKGRIVISHVMNGSTITISVKDNGIGISNETQKKIFSDFDVITSHGTKNERGSGLGLKLCKEFAKKNGGEIWVVSEIGKGSEFFFTVPKEREGCLE
ncbi:MAG: HAMP domain-containing histidine kinase [Melioribacteraceae bacterium]|nr:HAMP domain-containing histidine kinase [Melioribacteraceae bacterium]